MPAEVVDPQGPVDQSSADTEVLPACFAEQAGVFHSEGMMTNLNFKCVNAPCGSGKTTAAMHEADTITGLGQRVLIAQPSRQLVAETEKRLLDFSRRPLHRFDTDTCGSGRVKAALADHLMHHAEPGQIVLTTHTALLTLPYFHRREDWHVIIDEIPSGHEGYQLNLAEEHRILTDHVEIREDGRSNAVYHSMYPTEAGRQRLQGYVDNPRRDHFWSYLTPVAERLLHPDWHVVTEASSYYGILDRDGLEGRDSVFCYADLKPEALAGFASVTLMGAWFEHSLLYRLWVRQGVVFEPHTRIQNRLLFQQHANGRRLRLLWGYDHGWSKRAMNREVEMIDGSRATMWDALVAGVEARFSTEGRPFLYVGNKDRADDLRASFQDFAATAIPHSPYGHNQYQDHHAIAVLPALNPPPHEYGYLNRYGIDAEDVRAWIYQQWCYQAMNRTSLRNHEAEEAVTVVVADRDTADTLAQHYPGCTVAPLGIPLKVEPETRKGGRPRKAKSLTAAERQRRRRERIGEARLEVEILNGGLTPQEELRQRVLAGSDVVTNTSLNDSGSFRDSTLSQVLASNPVSGARPFLDLLDLAGREPDLSRIEISLFGSIYSTDRETTTVADGEAFIAQLKACHRTSIRDKHKENALANTTVFDETLSEESDRGLANIVSIWGIWLDVDDGEMPPDVIPKLFPTTRMVVYNSYSGGNSYRVFIPTRQKMHVQAYREVVQQIVQTVEQEGYCSKKHPVPGQPRHGIDASKFTPCSLFYLPCQARNPEESFFHDYGQSRRKLLDVAHWIETSILREPEAFVFEPTEVEWEVMRAEATEAVGDRRAVLMERYIAEYTALADGMGRYHAFFRLAWKLHYILGFPLYDLDWWLWKADIDGSRTDEHYRSIHRTLQSGRYAPMWRSRYQEAA